VLLISVPTLALLFLQNKQIQTSLSELASEKIAEQLNAEISLTSVYYSFFKRLQVHDFLIYDQQGDTLIYSEVVKLRFKRFRPDRKNILIRKLSVENAYIQLITNEEKISSIQFLVDALKRDIPVEEKNEIKLEKINLSNSRFRLINPNYNYKGYGIDFSDLDVRNLDANVSDFHIFMDTTSMQIKNLSGYEVTGFRMNDVDLHLAINQKFLSFRQASIQTPLSSVNLPMVDFRYTTSKNFKHLYDSVKVNISSSNSFLDFQDIAYFFQQVKDLNGQINLNGSVFGKFGDLTVENIEIDYENQTHLEFDMRLVGLPSTDSLLMDFKFREFSSTPAELMLLTSNLELDILSDSSRITGIETLNYKGVFYGYKTDFETRGALTTNIGNLRLDLNMRPDSEKGLQFKGNLLSEGFDLGKLLDQDEKLGKLAMNVQVEGANSPDNFEALISGMIDTLGIFGYDYSNINLEGIFNNKRFDGNFSIRDPNIDLIFKGKIDLSTETPSYNFTADVANLRPYYLNLREDDPEYFASFLLKTNLTGKNISELNGDLQLVNSLFRRTGSQVQIYDMLLTTGNSQDSSFITLSSDMLDFDIRGRYKLTDLPASFAGVINDHYNIIPEYSSKVDSINTFNYQLNLKDVNPLFEFFLPKFSISRDVQLQGTYTPDHGNYRFTSKIQFPGFGYSGIYWKNLRIDLESDTSRLSMEIKGDSLNLGSDFDLKNPRVLASFQNNKNDIRILWDNESIPSYSGNLQLSSQVIPSANDELYYHIQFKPSNFYYDSKRFDIASSRLRISPEGFEIDSLLITGQEQMLLADGTYSGREEDSLMLDLTGLNLDLISNLNTNVPIDFSGSLSGIAALKNTSGRPLITSELVAEDLVINQQKIGRTAINAKWLESTEVLELEVLTQNENSNNIKAQGRYVPKSDILDFDLELNQLNLLTFQPIVEEYIEDLNGVGNIYLAIDGSLRKPVINGNIALQDAAFTLNATQCRYYVSDSIRVYKNDIYFDQFSLTDEYGKEMSASGNISTADLKRVFLNIDLNAENFNFLATSRFDNEQFYGNIFASARAEIRGPVDELIVKVSASTERRTNLKLPLYNATEIQSTDFITFISTSENELPVYNEIAAQKNSVELDMDLAISDNSTVQLIFDPKVGDIIEASGNGNLKLKLDKKGELTMLGDVLIADGEYLFTLQNVINKRFRVKPGGTISWNGSPTSALINLEAIYETKASPYSLSPEPREELKKRIPVQCLLSLQGELSNPLISPSIELPTAEPETRSLIEASIGTEEDLMRQFISLLVINNFISNVDFNNNPIAGGSSGVAGVTASELLSNQLSNWLSQISSDFDIGVNYRPGDAISSDEVEVALSTQILNDRIIFSGNLDVLGDQVTTSSGEASNIVGDFDLEFRVSDKISLKAFNRVNDDRIVRPSLYTQGVGVLYRNEFNKISDLFQNRNSRSDKKSTEKPEKQNANRDEEEASE